MSFEDDVKLIDSYNDWVLERKRMAADLSPEAFLADRMKEDAADRLLGAIDWFENNAGKFNHNREGRYDYDFSDKNIYELEKILRGDL